MASQLERELCCIMHYWGFYQQNCIVNSVCVDDWTAKWAIIAINEHPNRKKAWFQVPFKYVEQQDFQVLYSFCSKKYKGDFHVQKSAGKEYESISVSVDIMYGLENGSWEETRTVLPHYIHCHILWLTAARHITSLGCLTLDLSCCLQNSELHEPFPFCIFPESLVLM